jgi:hypothetical protein
VGAEEVGPEEQELTQVGAEEQEDMFVGAIVCPLGTLLLFLLEQEAHVVGFVDYSLLFQDNQDGQQVVKVGVQP